ncbi:hypothetical protein ACQKIC_05785 [Peribacillus sp. NPDC046944]|uniref:hypothetical protein n=1 Tax=Peribacillus sp. NPDC046944 TaxID=3390607 RepID=UPI003CFF09D3
MIEKIVSHEYQTVLNLVRDYNEIDVIGTLLVFYNIKKIIKRRLVLKSYNYFDDDYKD